MKNKIYWDESYCSKINSCTHKNNKVVENPCGLTELHIMALRNKVKEVELLLSEDVNVNCKNNCGQTPLLIAVKNKYIEVAETLLSYRANANITDLEGYSPLQTAIDLNDEEMINLLTAYSMGG